MPLLLLVVAVGVLLVWGVLAYNRFIEERTYIENRWANIDTELRRRYDLIPNVVESVKGYASHERETFENVTAARAMAANATGSPAEQAAAEGPLVAALRQLFAVAEAYPDLKANQNFLQLQEELSATEQRLATARMGYNDAVRGYNKHVQSFPSMAVARMFGFDTKEYFEVPDSTRGDEGVPRVDFSVSSDETPPPPPPAPPADEDPGPSS